jgi:hypothetical protein
MTTRLCDFIIFWSLGGRDIFAPAELKGGHVKPTRCLAQLQNGANLAHTLLGTLFQRMRFVPLIVHRGGLSVNEIRILRQRRVSFRGERRLAALVKSGTLLATAVA